MSSEVKEEVITSYRDLKPGDKLRITREVEVRTANSWEGIRTKDNRTYRIDGADYSLPGFNVVRLTPLNTHPENWPPQKNDVWELPGAVVYHVHYDTHGQLMAFDSGGYRFSLDQLDKKDSKLVYRKGNLLR